MKAIKQYFPVVLFIMLGGGGLLNKVLYVRGGSAWRFRPLSFNYNINTNFYQNGTPFIYLKDKPKQ